MKLRLMFYFCVLSVSGDLCAMGSNQFTYTLFEGVDRITPLIPFIAQQRITMFKEYPYLYQGTRAGEYAYLSWFAQVPSSAVVVAYEGDTPIAFLTGVAFTDFESHFQGSVDLFVSAGLVPADYYYVSDVIVLPAYRNKSICRQLSAILEEYARTKGFVACCFVCEHHEQHPLKPADYKELDPLFCKLGYHKTDLVIFFDWETIQPDGTSVKMSHPLTYWIKSF